MIVEWVGQEWRVEDRRASSAPHFLLTNPTGQVAVLPDQKAYDKLALMMEGTA